MITGQEGAYRRLVGRYTDALHAWDGNERVRAAAATLGMTERQYCDHYIARTFGPLVWTSTSNTSAPVAIDADAAYRDAVIFRAEASQEGQGR